MKTLGGYLLVGTAILACPCHLVVTLPLTLAFFSGTALGAFLTENPGAIFALFTVYFVAALWAGMALLSRRDAAEDGCAVCVSAPQQASSHGSQGRTQGEEAPVASRVNVQRPSWEVRHE